MVQVYGLDTTFLVDLSKGLLSARNLALQLVGHKVCTTQLNLYELLIGVFASSDSADDVFEKVNQITDRVLVLNLEEASIQKSAQIAAYLLSKGQRLDDIDCLTAGILLSNNCDVIITRNADHFKRIPGLKVKTY